MMPMAIGEVTQNENLAMADQEHINPHSAFRNPQSALARPPEGPERL
jgi:hypothetical protein